MINGKSECVLCGKLEDERNIQEQIGKPICNSCNGKYTDDEMRMELDYQNKLMWVDYYRYLDIPDKWENVSYGNDELPSFSHNGYQIWINHPTLEGRQQGYLGIGHQDLSEFEDWKFAVTYEFDYGEVTNNLLYTMYFDEVVNFVKKIDMYAIKQLLEHHTNYHLKVKEWQDYEVRNFIKDLLNGNTEYCLDDKFPKQTFIDFKRIS